MAMERCCAYVQGVTAFLERTNWAKACGGEARPLLPGTLMEVVVTAAPKQARTTLLMMTFLAVLQCST